MTDVPFATVVVLPPAFVAALRAQLLVDATAVRTSPPPVSDRSTELGALLGRLGAGLLGIGIFAAILYNPALAVIGMCTGFCLLRSFGSPDRVRLLLASAAAGNRLPNTHACGIVVCQPSTGPNLSLALIAVAFVTFFYNAILFFSVGRLIVAPGAVKCSDVADDDETGYGQSHSICNPFSPREVWAAWSWLLSAFVALVTLALAGRVLRGAADFEAASGVRLTGRCCTRERAVMQEVPALGPDALTSTAHQAEPRGRLAAADELAAIRNGDEILVHSDGAHVATPGGNYVLTIGIGRPVEEERLSTAT